MASVNRPTPRMTFSRSRSGRWSPSPVPMSAPARTAAAFDETGKVVRIKRADNGRWALPGGYAEVGSTPATNALREFHEETGLDAAIERLIGVYDNREFASVSPYHFYTCLFRAR